MNIVYLEVPLHPKNQTFTHGLTPNSKLAQNLAEVDINLEMLHARNRGHQKSLMKPCAIHLQSPQNGKSVDHWTVRLSGLKANGANVQHHVDKREPEIEKFIVRKSTLMGNLLTL